MGEILILKCEKSKHNNDNIAKTYNNNNMKIMDQDKKRNNIWLIVHL